ncbi:hypothetical protein AKO1_014633 [Acrasis kona]|uniref:COMM domain-containing protein 1 n=1 Tax=Acrasis kona TaxID=1008807 RepID=A0AAW2Z1U8_9EUKA
MSNEGGFDVTDSTFTELLNSVSRSLLENDDLTSLDENSLFQDAEVDEKTKEVTIKGVANLINDCASRKLNSSHLKDYLASNGGLNEEQIQIFLHFWSTHSSKHNSRLVKNASFGKSLANEGLKWRVDQVTNVKNLSEITQTVAVVELLTKENNANNQKFSFEVTSSTLNNILEQLNQIQDRIDILST